MTISNLKSQISDYKSFPVNHAFWQQLVPQPEVAATVDSRKRLRALAATFVVLWAGILARGVQLEWRYGNAFRSEALKPLRREIALPAVRGRILANDGTALATDERLRALAVHYRYLQHSPDDDWLRNQARRRLTKAERRDRERVESEMAKLRGELHELNQRLAAMCGLSAEAWQTRTTRIENRIEKMAVTVNTNRWERYESKMAAPQEPKTRPPWWNVAANLPDALRALGTPEEAVWEPVILKEQVDYHIVVENLPAQVAAEIQGHPERFPGVRVMDVARRTYPGATLAANVLGHLARPSGEQSLAETGKRTPGVAAATDAFVGVLGLERVCETRLAGIAGEAVEHTDRGGNLINTRPLQPARDGGDVHLTLDPKLQQAAEALLDRALLRNRSARGGAIALLSAEEGNVLALATAPRFDPNAFALGESDVIHRTLANPYRPMFDRATRMALPTGSLVKPFIALSLLESKRVPPYTQFRCEGYLRDPDGLRCALYRQQGMGHGDVTLAGALACNCNTYFAHYADILGPELLVDGMQRFGFGDATGITLGPEATGTLPKPVESEDGQTANLRKSDARLLTLGQGNFTATPLQVARAMAAVATGRLMTPRLIEEDPAASTINALVADAKSLALVRTALSRSCVDQDNADQEATSIDGTSIASMAASGEVAGDKRDHAWCAGYFPAETPRYAFAIAIEHGGDGEKVAAPIARRFALRVLDLHPLEERMAQQDAELRR